MVSAKVKNLFFDRKAVIDAIGKVAAAALSKMGSYIRRSARSLIRPRKRPAEPGKPPSSHLGLLRDFIFFSFDSKTKSVVVGPELLNGHSNYAGGETVPQILEEGGSVMTRRESYLRVNGGRDEQERFRQDNFIKKPAGTQLKFHPHPFMRPARDANIAKFPEAFGQ